jgi:magnesium-transporting ATPase (P-type)
VRRAKAAGIKLVLMTGEHIEAASGLAKPVGLLSLPTNLDLQAQGRGELESEEECQSIVVDSSRMIKVYEDGEEEGESRLLSWLRKK